jgi:gamma-glutamyl-gamma-aminobutyrate hydrolase PuuD
MKNILITQIVNFSKKRGYQYSLSKEWIDYSAKIGINLIPYSYNFSKKNLTNLKVSGVIFSGGNDLNFLKKKKENYFRDKEEIKLFRFFLKKKIPIICICRGFQLIAHQFGGSIVKTKFHVKKNHKINVIKKDFFKKNLLYVNSYHNFSVNHLPRSFEIISRHDDNSIEIAKYNNKLFCLMFHPERKNFSQKLIDQYFKKILKIK